MNRDEMIEVADQAVSDAYISGTENYGEAVLDAILPQVNTEAELNALPAGSLVMTHGSPAHVMRTQAGIACTCHWENDDKHGQRSQHRHLASLAPLTVVWRPDR